MPDDKKPEPKGWVDAALETIQSALDAGISLDDLPHDVQQTLAVMRERAEGKRATHAAELDHVKQAARVAKARLADLRSGRSA
jgi:hypothetical protein